MLSQFLRVSVIIVFFQIVFVNLSQAEHYSFTLDASNFLAAPDGLNKGVSGFNNSIPGPLFTFQEGDTVEFLVNNNLYSQALAVRYIIYLLLLLNIFKSRNNEKLQK